MARNSVFNAAGEHSLSPRLAMIMRKGSILTAGSAVNWCGGSNLKRAIVSAFGPINLGGNNAFHKVNGTVLAAPAVNLGSGGNMQVSESIFTSNLNVNQGAKLISGIKGNGPLANAKLNAGKLGTSISANWILGSTVVGDLDLKEGAILGVLTDPRGDSEGIIVDGQLKIGKGVRALLVPSNGFYSKQSRTAILAAAASVDGNFDGPLSNSDLLKVKLITNSATAFANNAGGTTLGYSTLLGPLFGLEFQRKNLTNIPVLAQFVPHKLLVAMDKLLDKAADSPAFAAKLGKLKILSSADVLDIVDGFQPSQLKALAMSQENNAVNVRNTLSIRFQRELDAMHCASSASPSGKCDVKAKPIHAWATGFGDNMYQGHVSEYGYGFQNNMGGFSAGVDYHFADVLYAGALGAYTSSDIDWLNGRGSGDITTGYAGLYMSAISKMYWGTIAVLGGWSDYSSDRNFFLQNNRFSLSNSHNGSQILSHADTGINFGFKGFTIRPFDSFDYISQTENSFHEKGSGPLNIEIDDQTSIMIRNELGINFAGCFCIRGMQWTVSPKISWVREVRVKGKTINAEFEDVDQSFEVDGYFPSRSLVSPGITLQGNFKDDLFTVGLYYNGVFQGNYSDHSYGGQIRFGF